MMKIAYQCMNDSTHLFKGKCLDGVQCPICRAPVLTKPYDEQEHNELPEYRELLKQNRVTYDEQDVKQALVAMGIDLDTSQFKLKLRAISKHTEALANELDAIDAGKCPNCGNSMNIIELFADSESYTREEYCEQCNK